MRVIIEVENGDELEQALAALQAETFKNQPIQVRTLYQARSPRERQAILQPIYDRYQIELPPDWTFNRDEANER